MKENKSTDLILFNRVSYVRVYQMDQPDLKFLCRKGQKYKFGSWFKKTAKEDLWIWGEETHPELSELMTLKQITDTYGDCVIIKPTPLAIEPDPYAIIPRWVVKVKFVDGSHLIRKFDLKAQATNWVKQKFGDFKYRVEDE